MNLKTSIAILSSVIILCCGIFALVINFDKTSKLDKIMKSLEHNDTSKAVRVYNTLSSEEKTDLVSILDKNPEKFPPVFYVLTADFVYKSNKDKAVFFYFLGNLLATEDAMMCKNSSALEQLTKYPILAKDTLAYVNSKIEDADYSIGIMQKTLDWDDAHTNRYNPKWACYHGISSIYKKPELVDETEFKNIRAQVRGEVKKSIELRRDKNKFEQFLDEHQASINK